MSIDGKWGMIISMVAIVKNARVEGSHSVCLITRTKMVMTALYLALSNNTVRAKVGLIDQMSELCAPFACIFDVLLRTLLHKCCGHHYKYCKRHYYLVWVTTNVVYVTKNVYVTTNIVDVTITVMDVTTNYRGRHNKCHRDRLRDNANKLKVTFNQHTQTYKQTYT